MVELYGLLERDGVTVWIDGGWAVDAHLGEQTRPHGDLDLALDIAALERLTRLLGELGFRPKGEARARPWNFVLVDGRGREVDLHAFSFDGHGNGILGPPENHDVYPAHSLTGTGTLLGRAVRCIAVEDLIEFHTGYEPDDDDRRDLFALCARFGIEPPEPYRR